MNPSQNSISTTISKRQYTSIAQTNLMKNTQVTRMKIMKLNLKISNWMLTLLLINSKPNWTKSGKRSLNIYLMTLALKKVIDLESNYEQIKLHKTTINSKIKYYRPSQHLTIKISNLKNHLNIQQCNQQQKQLI